MVTAKCNRCLGSAEGDSFEDARSKLNHAIGKSRGIPCGDNYNCVVEIKDETTKHVEKKIDPKAETPKPVEKTTIPQIDTGKKSKISKSKHF